MSQKNITASPKTAQASQRQPKGRHENAQETPEEPKGWQKIAGGLPEFYKNEGKTEKESKTKTRLFRKFQSNSKIANSVKNTKVTKSSPKTDHGGRVKIDC